MRKKWPASQPKDWPISKIVPYPSNPRTHPAEQIALLASLMKKHGVDQPIVVDEDGVIIKGHGRRLAAIEAGFKTFPVVVHRGLSEDDKRAIRLADNQVALLSGWEPGLLRSELTQLSTAGYEMPLLGFSNSQLVAFMADAPTGADPDDAPTPPDEPASRLGDLWQLGKHRLLCGDSTKREDVLRAFAGEQPGLIITDPPYGVDFERGKFVGPSKRAKGGIKFEAIEGDNLKGAALSQMISTIIDVSFGDRPGVFYFWSAFHEGYSILTGIEAAGVKVQSQIIWRKTPFVLGRADYHWQHEVCWYGFRGKNHPWYGGRDKGTVWDIAKPSRMESHPTQKPVDCMKIPMENSSLPGDFVYEPFAGSGTTIIAAEMTIRRCLAIELSPIYVDVAVRRWQEFAKEEATLIGDGRTFAEIEGVRKKAPRRSSGAQGKANQAEAAE